MITSLYAIPIAIIFLVLSARVIMYRLANQIGLGDAGNKSLLKRMRAHANFVEYAPFGLLLMLLLELQTPADALLHLVGGLLLLGRVSHAYGFSASPPILQLRQAGMIMTFGAYITAIICLVAFAVTAI